MTGGDRPAIPAHGLRHRLGALPRRVATGLASLAGGRSLPERDRERRVQVGDSLTARIFDGAMRAADRAGVRRARERVVAGARGDVLEIGIGTGLNLSVYPADASLHAIDESQHALAIAARRASRLGRSVVLATGDAAALPYPDGSFDAVVATFVLCSVGDVATVLGECRRVLRPGGTLRVLEHARSDHRGLARLQARLAPAWSLAAGGCRLDHDVRTSIEAAGLRIVDERARARGLLVEVVATAE